MTSYRGQQDGRKAAGKSAARPSTRLTPEEKARAERAIRTLGLFMEQMPGAVITDLAMLLSIGAHYEGQGEHGVRLGLDRSGASVATRRLGAGGRGSYREGMGWVDYEPDPNDDRRKIPVLTAEGEAMARLLLQAMAPE